MWYTITMSANRDFFSGRQTPSASRLALRFAVPVFLLYQIANIGLLKDGKMGVSLARTDRIRTAISYQKGG